jgi:hypothetical protein
MRTQVITYMKQLVALTYDTIFIKFISHISFNHIFFMSFWLVAKGVDQHVYNLTSQNV